MKLVDLLDENCGYNPEDVQGDYELVGSTLYVDDRAHVLMPYNTELEYIVNEPKRFAFKLKGKFYAEHLE